MHDTDYSESPEKLNNSERIEIVKEEISVRKEIMEEGKHIFKKVVEEHPVSLDIALTSEKYSVEREERNIELDVIPKIRTEGNKTIVPIVKEVAVVVKKLILTEEIIITKNIETNTETLTETVREEKLKHEYLPKEN